MDRYRDKTALVTGATSGIGVATARRLVAEGMHVVACGRRQDRLAALQAELGAGLSTAIVDLRDEQSIAAMFAEARARRGGIDVLVNNAGLGHDAPLSSGSTAHWREMLEVNVLALCICTREALADMRARGDAGHVVHISSMAAYRVPPGSGVYSASKFAVRALTEGLRQELREAGSRVRVSAISPGYVETEFAERYHQSEEAARNTYGRFPVLQPEDIAEAVVYVLSQPEHVQVHDVLMRPTDQPN